MQSISFQALGTEWKISIDESIDISHLKPKINSLVTSFEKSYSRFDPNSLLSQYNAGKTVQLTKEFLELEKFAKKLEKVSEGHFDAKVGETLGKLGYGSGKQGLDFGAFGKGWLIDKIASLLKKNKLHYFLINAGGDIFATQKKSGKSWTVALEIPSKENEIFGTTQLKNAALAASSPFKRKWGENTHLIDGLTKKPIKDEKSVFVIAREAKTADGFATLFNIIPNSKIPKVNQSTKVKFLIINESKILKSKNFVCRIFNI